MSEYQLEVYLEHERNIAAQADIDRLIKLDRKCYQFGESETGVKLLKRSLEIAEAYDLIEYLDKRVEGINNE